MSKVLSLSWKSEYSPNEIVWCDAKRQSRLVRIGNASGDASVVAIFVLTCEQQTLCNQLQKNNEDVERAEKGGRRWRYNGQAVSKAMKSMLFCSPLVHTKDREVS
jgi:hypothetical protein